MIGTDWLMPRYELLPNLSCGQKDTRGLLNYANLAEEFLLGSSHLKHLNTLQRGREVHYRNRKER